ncbi:MAG: hypothetical protein E7617_05295 [Ruminococcaceae bacterium]|nr:hypothetical protein [Oscillospiraceae bacterium]
MRSKWSFFNPSQVKPEGWLLRQLEIQAEGLSGNLDKCWRDVRDSAWIGGDAEGWERVPYWLDGFIPLAYLLGNEDMIARAKKYIDAIISYQKESGWICPCAEENIPTYDTWAVQLISKVLVVYYDCSGDDRIPEVLYRVMKNYYDLLKSETVKLFDWGKYRWFEAFIAIKFLKERYSEPWLDSLAELLRAQGTDYTELTSLWKRPLCKWTYDTHIVNLVMMLKYEALVCDVLGEEYTDKAEMLHTLLAAYNGTPVGLYTGDECLSGLSPVQGTELCAVVEQMYSYELLYAETGDAKWAERLEVLAFNALPATISDDMWAHQYLQMSNQIACRKLPGRPHFGSNNSEAHIFGLEPNFGCCTANFNQGWPKLALSAFMYSGDTVLSAVPIPSSIKTESFSVTLKTDYPFKNRLEYSVSTDKDITLEVRIPSFAKELRVNGAEVSVREKLSMKLKAGTGGRIVIEFKTVPVLIDRPHDLKAVKCGSLVFSLPIAYEKNALEYEKKGVLRKAPYCDYEYIPTSDWQFGYASPFFEVEERSVGEVPFSSEKPPVVLKARVAPIVWGLLPGYETVAAMTPESRTPIGEEKTIELYPYGCAKLRMTEIPLV